MVEDGETTTDGVDGIIMDIIHGITMDMVTTHGTTMDLGDVQHMVLEIMATDTIMSITEIHITITM